MRATKAGGKQGGPAPLLRPEDGKSALGICLLRFGELEGAQSYTNESVTIIWPDGSSDQISFNRDFRWKANGDPEIKEK